MWQDVVDLNAFYASPAGQVARRMIRRRVRAIWPDTRGLRVLGLGFATPYLRPFRDEAERVIALMPASQGVMPWPADERRLVALTDEAELPFPENVFDRVLIVHAVECSEQLRPMLREIWRVLAGNGRILVVTPNRRSIWARLERTPFGQGQPFSRRQLTRLLRENLFSPLQSASALYVPPGRTRLMLRFAGTWENLGERWGLPFAGALLIEAGKRVYAANPERLARRAPQRGYPELAGHPAPSPRDATRSCREPL
ncbi:MAG: methyltransferase domain-containing protein [Alphaproteobacteria bacterium]